MIKFKEISARAYDYTLNSLLFYKEGEIREEVVNLISLPPEKKLKILDVGCGTGTQLIEIKTENPDAECYGIDASEDMLKIARKKAQNKKMKINLSVQNFTNLNFPEKYFDAVIATLALHEASGNKLEKAMSEIKRVLKNNGNLIIFDYKKIYGKKNFIQKMFLYFLDKQAGNFIDKKENLFKNFKKEYSKDIFKILSIEKYSKLKNKN